MTGPWDLVPSDPLISCVTSKPVSPSVAQGGGGPSVQASRAPLRPGPYLTHTGQGVRGWGRGSGHQPGVGGGHRYWAGWGPRGPPGRPALEGKCCGGEVRRRAFTGAFKLAEAQQLSGLAVAGNILKTVLISFSIKD